MKKSGAVEAINLSPTGIPEGFLLRAGRKLVQINLPKEHRESMGKSIDAGEKVTAEVEPEDAHGEPSHEVFRLVRWLGAHASASPEKRAERFAGRVARLNYALHGEINGGILESGDFLHLKPAGARALQIKTGMQVEGIGHRKPLNGGCPVIEATEVNGIEIRRHKGKK